MQAPMARVSRSLKWRQITSWKKIGKRTNLSLEHRPTISVASVPARSEDALGSQRTGELGRKLHVAVACRVHDVHARP